jgi:hypothetical protein
MNANNATVGGHTNGLTDQQIKVVCMAINAFTEDGAPFATPDNLQFFRLAHVRECVSKMLAQENVLTVAASEILRDVLAVIQ